VCLEIINYMTDQLTFLQEGTFFGQNNSDLEEVVLGTFINYPDRYYEFADQVNIKGFSTESSRYVFTAIKECAEDSKIDIITVTDKVTSKGYNARIIEKTGYTLIDYINDIADRVSSDAHIKQHIKLLMAYSTMQMLKNIILSKLYKELLIICQIKKAKIILKHLFKKLTILYLDGNYQI